MNDDYTIYVDDVLLALAERQTGPNLIAVNLDDLNHELFRDRPPTWVQTLVGELTRRGYGEEPYDAGNARVIRINGAGLTRAAEIRRERAPKPLVDRLAEDRTQKLLNVGAFGVSCVSLVVAIIALLRSGS